MPAIAHGKEFLLGGTIDADAERVNPVDPLHRDTKPSPELLLLCASFQTTDAPMKVECDGCANARHDRGGQSHPRPD